MKYERLQQEREQILKWHAILLQMEGRTGLTPGAGGESSSEKKMSQKKIAGGATSGQQRGSSSPGLGQQQQKQQPRRNPSLVVLAGKGPPSSSSPSSSIPEPLAPASSGESRQGFQESESSLGGCPAASMTTAGRQRGVTDTAVSSAAERVGALPLGRMSSTDSTGGGSPRSMGGGSPRSTGSPRGQRGGKGAQGLRRSGDARGLGVKHSAGPQKGGSKMNNTGPTQPARVLGRSASSLLWSPESKTALPIVVMPTTTPVDIVSEKLDVGDQGQAVDCDPRKVLSSLGYPDPAVASASDAWEQQQEQSGLARSAEASVRGDQQPYEPETLAGPQGGLELAGPQPYDASFGLQPPRLLTSTAAQESPVRVDSSGSTVTVLPDASSSEEQNMGMQAEIQTQQPQVDVWTLQGPHQEWSGSSAPHPDSISAMMGPAAERSSLSSQGSVGTLDGQRIPSKGSSSLGSGNQANGEAGSGSPATPTGSVRGGPAEPVSGPAEASDLGAPPPAPEKEGVGSSGISVEGGGHAAQQQGHHLHHHDAGADGIALGGGGGGGGGVGIGAENQLENSGRTENCPAGWVGRLPVESPETLLVRYMDAPFAVGLRAVCHTR